MGKTVLEVLGAGHLHEGPLENSKVTREEIWGLLEGHPSVSEIRGTLLGSLLCGNPTIWGSMLQVPYYP